MTKIYSLEITEEKKNIIVKNILDIYPYLKQKNISEIVIALSKGEEENIIKKNYSVTAKDLERIKNEIVENAFLC